MEIKQIIETTNKWENLIQAVLSLKPLDSFEFVSLLADTYKTIKSFDNKKEVPKEVCKLLITMDEWLYFASLMEEKEVGTDFYNYQATFCIVSAIKNGFFTGDYKYCFATAKTEEIYTINISKEEIAAYLQSVKDQSYKKHSGIKLI